LAVADLAGLRGFDDGGHSALDAVVGEDEFEFDLGQEIDGIFAASVNFGVAFLAAKAFNFGDGHPFDADFTERIFDFLQLEWFYDGFDFLHRFWGLVSLTHRAASLNLESTARSRWLEHRKAKPPTRPSAVPAADNLKQL